MRVLLPDTGSDRLLILGWADATLLRLINLAVRNDSVFLLAQRIDDAFGLRGDLSRAERLLNESDL